MGGSSMAFLGVLAFFALVLPALAANRINYIPVVALSPCKSLSKTWQGHVSPQ
ncbi:hypothetical protein FH972_005033 [Carpinus fangiana]|uniref:Uncharacterized protein n=1 Tax=Carpinus fangiana TaxID=176857 RepID=A0A5N6QQF4_9ROSI|nr:hypothetical protein FH972_005033 [Carpinus fangiana]